MTIAAINKEEKVIIHELLGSGDSDRIETMLKLYGTLFPNYEHYIPRMRRRSQFDMNIRPGVVSHYWLIEVDNKPMGMTTFRYIQERNCGLGISFALLPEARSVTVDGKRLSGYIIAKTMEQFLADAQQLESSEFLGMVTEVEHVELMNHYKRMGMLELPIKYLEPVFPMEKDGQTREEEIASINFLPAILGLTPSPAKEQNHYSQKTITNFALAFLVDHYGLPECHLMVQSILQSIPEEN